MRENKTRRNKLRAEAMGLFGMLAEVRSKCQIFKGRCRDDDFEDEMLDRMDLDLARYSRRLYEIHEELNEIQ